ncbi:MAG: hypothetical protein JO042_15150 [Sinobacteraceae bacterium]|nr:hypothetical protein [Nevskiaceae bacterium]
MSALMTPDNKRTRLQRLIALGRTFGPYLAIELILPGGSLVALLLWLYRTAAKAS